MTEKSKWQNEVNVKRGRGRGAVFSKHHCHKRLKRCAVFASFRSDGYPQKLEMAPPPSLPPVLSVSCRPYSPRLFPPFHSSSYLRLSWLPIPIEHDACIDVGLVNIQRLEMMCTGDFDTKDKLLVVLLIGLEFEIWQEMDKDRKGREERKKGMEQKNGKTTVCLSQHGGLHEDHASGSSFSLVSNFRSETTEREEGKTGKERNREDHHKKEKTTSCCWFITTWRSTRRTCFRSSFSLFSNTRSERKCKKTERARREEGRKEERKEQKTK